jgi:hypothetical protein
MEKILLQRTEDGWTVSNRGATETYINLDFAAKSALQLAEELGAGEPQIGPGVPTDALDRGRRLIESMGRPPAKH